MKSEFSTERTTSEKVVIATLIFLGTALLLGIQSLFLTHIAAALPQDNLWQLVTVLCFLAPPFSFAGLAILKMNFSRSTAQDYVLYAGITLELLLFVINLVVSVNAQQIAGTMLGTIGILLGGVAGVVSAGTTAYTLAADPLRGIAKAKIIHELKIEKAKQQKVEALVEQAMSAPGVLQAAERAAETFVRERLEQAFGARANEGALPQMPVLPPVLHDPEGLAKLLRASDEAQPNGGKYTSPKL